VPPHADVVILVDQVLGTGGGGWPTGADIVEVVDSSSAGGAAQVVLEATLGAGSVLQRCHVLAVIVSDVDVPGPSGGCRVHIDVDAVACLAITVHDHVLSGVGSADDWRRVGAPSCDLQRVGASTQRMANGGSGGCG